MSDRKEAGLLCLIIIILILDNGPIRDDIYRCPIVIAVWFHTEFTTT